MSASKLKPFLFIAAAIVVVAGVIVSVMNADRLKQMLTAMGNSGNLAPQADPHAGHDHGDGGKHIELTAQARDNLKLETGRITLSDYSHTLQVPGVVREKPGHSDHAVATTVNGIVKRVHATPGQTVKPGDPLFDLQLTGEALASAQAGLLDLLQQVETLDVELKRITPLAESGGLAAKRKLELEYERKRLVGQRDVRAQELLVRGLHPSQVEQIVTKKQLIREFTVRVPDHFVDDEKPAESTPSDSKTAPESPADELAHEEMQFSVETLDVFPGKAVRPGDSLCHLAYHTVLYVEGQAFENEIEAIGRLQQNGWTANLEFGTAGDEIIRKGAEIHYLDNHVDPDSQTFRFYVKLDNEILQETRDKRGKLYRSWRFKPGQRAHVIIPIKKWERQLKLPLAAVVQEGPNAFIFRRIARMRAPDGETFNDVFEQVPVRVLHLDVNPKDPVDRERKYVVLSADGTVKPGDIVAMNNAYQLQLAITSSSGGGGGHGHSHHGHSH